MKVTPTLRVGCLHCCVARAVADSHGPSDQVADVIRSLARNRKYRLSIYHDEYVLKLGKDDQARLRRSAPELSPRDIIEALEVEEVQLCKRAFQFSRVRVWTGTLLMLLCAESRVICGHAAGAGSEETHRKRRRR